jgi:hypothetical protein
MAPRVEEPTTLAPIEDAALEETAPVKPELETPSADADTTEAEELSEAPVEEQETSADKLFDFASFGACCGFVSQAELEKKAREEEEAKKAAVRESMTLVLEELVKKVEADEEAKVIARAKELAARDAEILARREAELAKKEASKKKKTFWSAFRSCGAKGKTAAL